jgi:hypothetical protein
MKKEERLVFGRRDPRAAPEGGGAGRSWPALDPAPARPHHTTPLRAVSLPNSRARLRPSSAASNLSRDRVFCGILMDFDGGDEDGEGGFGDFADVADETVRK